MAQAAELRASHVCILQRGVRQHGVVHARLDERCVGEISAVEVHVIQHRVVEDGVLKGEVGEIVLIETGENRILHL